MKEKRIKGTCKVCGAELQVNMGDMGIDEVKAALKDRRDYQCPGYHLELGSMLDGYEWDFTPFEADPAPTDEEWVDKLQKEGRVVIDGGCGTVKGLKSLHSFRDLNHIGFGFFESETHVYERADSPRGTRFYVEVEKGINHRG